jgi:hypothetical protein
MYTCLDIPNLGFSFCDQCLLELELLRRDPDDQPYPEQEKLHTLIDLLLRLYVLQLDTASRLIDSPISSGPYSDAG